MFFCIILYHITVLYEYFVWVQNNRYADWILVGLSHLSDSFFSLHISVLTTAIHNNIEVYEHTYVGYSSHIGTQVSVLFLSQS